MEDLEDLKALDYLERAAIVEGERIDQPELEPDFFTLPDSQFLKNFRFSKNDVRRICDLIENNLILDEGRGKHSIGFQVQLFM